MRDNARNHWINRSDVNLGITPLMGAMFLHEDDVEQGVATTKMLVEEFGADVNQPDSGPGATPLFMAAQEGKPKMMQFLIALEK